MKYILLSMLFIACTLAGNANTPNHAPAVVFLPADVQQQANKIYDSLQLGGLGLERDIFNKAYKGYTWLLYRGYVQNTGVLTIADFSQSSKNKRLYVIDLANMKVAFNMLVSHGRNSGGEMATSFSNVKDSHKSTLGFLVTADTYNGSAGYSLRFNGMEPGINDLVRSRDIVVHGSRFVNDEKVSTEGKVGNSLGCPAVPMAQCKALIDLIKGGSVYFIYHPDEHYQASSSILNATSLLPPAPLMQNTNLLQLPVAEEPVVTAPGAR